jgi:hypothetical protein
MRSAATLNKETKRLLASRRKKISVASLRRVEALSPASPCGGEGNSLPCLANEIPRNLDSP